MNTKNNNLLFQQLGVNLSGVTTGVLSTPTPASLASPVNQPSSAPLAFQGAASFRVVFCQASKCLGKSSVMDVSFRILLNTLQKNLNICIVELGRTLCQCLEETP